MHVATQILFVLSFICICSATNWYISPFGNDNNSGTSSNSPLADLKSALSKASQGDTIYVATGTYSGVNNIGLAISGVKIIGTAGSTSTIFFGTSASPFIFNLLNGASIQGITASTATTAIEINGDLAYLTDVSVSAVSTGAAINQTQNVFFDKFSAANSVGTAIALTSTSSVQSISIINSNFFARNGFVYNRDLADLNFINITHSVFESQVVGSKGISISLSTHAAPFNFTISQSSFTGYAVLGGSSTSGAALSISAVPSALSNASITSTIFKNNIAQYGASLYISYFADVLISEVSVLNSTAMSAGGAFYFNFVNNLAIYNSEFVNCSNSATRYTINTAGGAIYLGSLGNILISNSSFLNNTAPASYGGAIFYPISQGVLTIENCIFNSSYALSGGALCAYGLVRINNTVFVNNVGYDGGAIYYGSTMLTSVSYILYSDFYSNSASFGGAIYASSGDITLNNATFSYNNADYDGGAIFCAATFSLFEAAFEYNRVGYYGGGMYITSYASVNLASSGFLGNSAASGGGFYCDTSAGVLLNTIYFTGNTSPTGSAYTCTNCLVTPTNIIVDPDNSISCAPQ